MVVQVTFMPQGKTVKVRMGSTVLAAARAARIHIPTRCGGNAGCLMCKIKTEPQNQLALTELTDLERRKLGELADQGVRLACQAKVQGEAIVHLPEDPLKAEIRRQLEAKRQEKEQD